MEFESVFRVVVFCGILGFAFFCASYAFQIWQARNSANRNAIHGGNRLDRPTTGLFLLGVVLLLAAAIWREVSPRSGVLSGDGVFTVRADAALKAEYVTEATSVQVGDVVARFRSPERRAEMAELLLKRQILAKQKEILQGQPLAPDAELVREAQNLQDERRQLASSIRFLVPEASTVTREGVRDQLDRLERINALKTRIEETKRESQSVIAELDKARRHRTRAQTLAAQSAVAPLEMDDRVTEVAVLESERAKLDERADNLSREIRQLETSTREFAACTTSQSHTLSNELTRTGRGLMDAESQLKLYQGRIMADLDRARNLKTSQLQQLELQIEQCQARVDGLQDVLVIKSPFSGTVAYREHAPQMALPLAPLAIIAPQEGFRFHARLPLGEIRYLAHAGSVPLSLRDPVLQRRFEGRLLGWQELPLEPGYALAELVCMPPPETIRELASRDWAQNKPIENREVWGRLIWRPPLVASPLFWPGWLLLALGGGGKLLLRYSRRRQWLTAAAKSPPTSPTPPAGSGGLRGAIATPEDLLTADRLDAGVIGRNLELLGRRFREAVRRRNVTPELLLSVEWALDRHQLRAVQHLAIAVDRDEQFSEEIVRLLDEIKTHGEEDTVASATWERVARIVRAISPGSLGGNGLATLIVDADREHLGLGRTPIRRSETYPV